MKNIKIIEQKFREDDVLPVSSKLEIIDIQGKTRLVKHLIKNQTPGNISHTGEY